MKQPTIYRIWIMLTALVLITLSCIIGTTTPSAPTPISQNPVTTPVSPLPPTPTIDLAYTIKATVQIYGLINQDGELTPFYSGSGTIISRTGLILTNAHVASPASRGNPQNEPDALAIGLIDQEDKPPVFLYLAKVVAVDGYMDLAVIQITSTLKGDDVDLNSLNLPFIKLGNSDALFVGQHINIFGYPGIGGDTITFTDGLVSGFNPEDQLGDRAWIKTNATIAGGNSGGLAADDEGFIIGVPSIVASGADSDPTDCRPVHDTNGDGDLNEKDICVPLGGFLNGIRSVNLAIPLIKAAQSGEIYVSPFDVAPPSPPSPSPQPSPSGSESFSPITWFIGTSSPCKVMDQVTSFPSGINGMVAAWSFSGMTDGEPWAEEWKLNGEVVYTSQYEWNSGSQGDTNSCLTSGKGFPDGNYHIELYAGANLDRLTQADVVVGGVNPSPQPGPSNQGVLTLFGQITDADSGNPLPGAAIYVLNPGITLDQWKTDQAADADVFTSAKTDDQGNYSLPDKLALDVGYTVVVFMEGYKITYGDDLKWTSKDPLNYQWDIALSK